MSQRGEQAQTMECRVIAELLPVYLNRGLEQEEARLVEAHLLTCPACRQDERDARSAQALFEGHLPVETLLDHALGQSMSARRRTVIESHLAVCERCAEELATIGEAPAGASSGVPRKIFGAGGSWTLAWAACLAAAIASAGWFWTWRQLESESATSAASAAHTNLAVVELLPATGSLLRGDDEAGAVANQVTLPGAGSELVLVLLAGGRSCESGCRLEIHQEGSRQPGWRMEGLVASPEGHLALSLPPEQLPQQRSIFVVRKQGSGEVVAEYLVERAATVETGQRQSPTSTKPAQ